MRSVFVRVRNARADITVFIILYYIYFIILRSRGKIFRSVHRRRSIVQVIVSVYFIIQTAGWMKYVFKPICF